MTDHDIHASEFFFFKIPRLRTTANTFILIEIWLIDKVMKCRSVNIKSKDCMASRMTLWGGFYPSGPGRVNEAQSFNSIPTK